MNILVTGASGFVGNALLQRLSREPGVSVRGTVRTPLPALPAGTEQIVVGDLGPDTQWAAAVKDSEVVVHTAARVHVMHEAAADPLSEFRLVNRDGTIRLAREAAAAGVRRFVFISSIKVNGEATALGRPYTPDDTPAPVDPYGISKLEAEIALRSLAADLGLELVIIRPTMVYGPGVKGNFLSMLRWLHKGVPLPLGAIRNKRSIVALDNLLDLLVASAFRSSAAGKTFLVSDGEDLSTPELLMRVAAALGRPARLVPVPVGALKFGGLLLGKRDFIQRLTGSLQVDISKTVEILGWSPPVGVDEALRNTALSFLAGTE